EPLALSPEGKYVAGWGEGNNRDDIEVWSVAEQRRLYSLTPEANIGEPHHLLFLDNDRLIALHSTPDGGRLTVWALRTQKRELPIEIGRPQNRESVAVSWGGQYLSVYGNTTVTVYDIASGAAVGEVP